MKKKILINETNLFLIKIIITCGFVCANSSCKKFVDVDPPKTSLVGESVFQNDDLATSALTNVYSTMVSSVGYASGGNLSITEIGGVLSDEFINYGNGTSLIQFYNNQVDPVNGSLLSLYTTPYSTIYKANSLIEGLEAPNKITPSTKKQLMGEAYFIRAFAYFNLVNLFGPIPLQLTSDYRITRVASRKNVNEVYQQIISDLKVAEGLLNDQYVTTERVRPNLSVVQALLARTYLYTNDWLNAEKYAILVLDKTNVYSLVPLDSVFLKNSLEAIWQLFPTANSNTQDGLNFILTATPTLVSLRSTFALNAFEANDKRKNAWIRIFSNSTGTYYYPFKYKIKSSTTVSEYQMVFRLAEQYLIRAEARVNLNNLNGGIDDIDMIRNRSGLPLIKILNPNINKTDLLIAIQNERKIELFSEWGHRWFDLKRNGLATSVLSPLKPQWQMTDELLPIPINEINRNPNITQNQGY